MARRRPSARRSGQQRDREADLTEFAERLHLKIAQTEVCATGSASQYPCGWLGTRHWKGGKIMSIPASTAALRPICQEIIPPLEMRLGPLG
jgi:hypothetical protein